jgi:hypothetical protein
MLLNCGITIMLVVLRLDLCVWINLFAPCS